MLTQVVAEEGAGVLLSGLVPRILWISAGGAVFLGAYELAKDILISMQKRTTKDIEGH
jgi:solute carrier family 25 (mitochondrial S-adenosylmethionine transporter), member 26